LKKIGGIKKLTNLVVLNAQHNEIESMRGLSKMFYLGALVLNNNHLSRIPKKIPTGVNTLILSHNKILELSDLNQLTNLQKLSLSWNQIGAISDALQNNTALTELRIRGNQISRIPPGIAENVHLRVLDVANNMITDKRGLQAICSLKHLRNLHIKGNPVALEPGINEWLRQQIPTLKLLEGKNVENTKFTEKSLIKKGKKRIRTIVQKKKKF